MQRDPNIAKLDRRDHDAGREVLMKIIKHTARCADCPVMRLIRAQAIASARKRRGQHACQ